MVLALGIVVTLVMLQRNQRRTHAKTRLSKTSWLTLDGHKLRVYWVDGDTFRIVGRSKFGRFKARLQQFNTLESYGPVHKWGKWTAQELKQNADDATRAARAGSWHCQTRSKKDRYGRVLLACTDLAKHLIARGLAHVYSIKGPGDKTLLKLQLQAQQKRLGMWAKGVPPYLVTSLHSIDEPYSRRKGVAYNRLISTSTGASKKVRHKKRYTSCSWVCLQQSCLLYVPYKQRHGRRRARCLR